MTWEVRFKTIQDSRPKLPNVSKRLAFAQRAESAVVLANVTLDFSWVRPGILPERPANRLPEKKFLRIQRRLDAGIEELEIGVLLESKLADDGRSSLPDITGTTPRAQRPANARGILS